MSLGVSLEASESDTGSAVGIVDGAVSLGLGGCVGGDPMGNDIDIDIDA